MELRDNNSCYVCGKDNPAGLQVEFTLNETERTLTGRFIPRPVHEGWEGIVHGGIITALLDESMVKLAAWLGIPAVSAEITVKFKSPASPGDELIITARLLRDAGRLIEAEASVLRGPVVIGEAKGKLLKQGKTIP